MVFIALQMSTNDPLFWIMVVIAAAFLVMAVMMIALAVLMGRVVKTINRIDERLNPLMQKVSALSEQGREIAAQGKQMAEQFTLVGEHLSTASMHFSESAGLIKEEVRELRLLVGETAVTARDKVALISRSIDQTHTQASATTAFIMQRVVEPARELAALMAGLRRALEVLIAPEPKPINQTYGEDEMFIG